MSSLHAARNAEQLGVSRATVHKWLRRHHHEGLAGLEDRSPRPHSTPTRTPAAVEDRVLTARAELRRGAVYGSGSGGQGGFRRRFAGAEHG
jgi:transposase-like protein